MIAMIMFLISLITPVIITDNIILMAMLTMPFISIIKVKIIVQNNDSDSEIGRECC